MQRRIYSALALLLAMCLIAVLFCACGSTAEPVTPESSESTQAPTVVAPTEVATAPASDNAVADSSRQESEAPTETQGTVLVIYFSHTGTTREVAGYLHELVGGDLVELIPAEPYPEGYSAALDPAKQEQRENARPAIQNPLESIDHYDVIYLGYPIWWGTVPMIVNTFLESYDFTGKTVVPFATSGGTGISQSITDIRTEIPAADVKDGLLVKSNDSILPWLQGLGLVE